MWMSKGTLAFLPEKENTVCQGSVIPRQKYLGPRCGTQTFLSEVENPMGFADRNVCVPRIAQAGMPESLGEAI